MYPHRIEETVFTSRVNIVQFGPIVAKHDEGNNWNSKNVEHNHGDLFVHAYKPGHCSRIENQMHMVFIVMKSDVVRPNIVLKWKVCKGMYMKTYTQTKSPRPVRHRPALLREVCVEVEIVGSQSHALARKQEEGLRRYLLASRFINIRFESE